MKLQINLSSWREIRADGKGKEKYYKRRKYFETNCDRLGNLIEKDLIFGELIKIPEILCAAHEVIQDELKVGGLNFRNPQKGMGNKRYILMESLDNLLKKNFMVSFVIFILIMLQKKTVLQE